MSSDTQTDLPEGMDPPPVALRDRLERHGQGHLLRWWDQLDAAGHARLTAQLRALDLEQLDRVVADLLSAAPHAALDPAHVGTVPVHRLPQTDPDRVRHRQAFEVGEAALEAGRVGVIVVAGGQGTRLGFDGPKGTFPIGPVSGASLFQIHAEKVRALSRRHGQTIPLYVMTSPQNHEATLEFFAENDRFGLVAVRFFMQGQMPAVDRETGRILLAGMGELALSPDGHGGTLTALAAPGPDGGPSCLDDMRQRGVDTLFYFQVDNPMVQIADPAFLGYHFEEQAEFSVKVVEKVLPDERVGVVVELDGRPEVIEYSDLPASLAEQRNPDRSLAYWAGSIAIHILDRGFIERLVAGGGQLPFHRALKKVTYMDADAHLVEPAAPNAVKFERFIFDALPLSRRWSIVETDRAVEFEPLKNASGTESPASVRQRMSDLFASWLEAAGAQVPRRPDGSAPFGIEISPLYALDPAELRRKLPTGLEIGGPLYLR